jgi:hypothetical protein
MNNGPFQPLFGGYSLAEWIRAGGRPERQVRAYFARQSWHAYWFEHNWRTQVHRLRTARLPEDPVFIMGLWRSGTTVLHELLGAITGWVTPQTWQCFNPSTCFLSAPPSRYSSVPRPMDQGRIANCGPQEDEFALLLLGGASVYRGFIDPRRLGECSKALGSLDDGDLARWQDFIRGVSVGTKTSRLLIKSPSHTFRLPLLRLLFPKAKFVWIGRHTGEVLASNVRMWSSMIDRYGLWQCPPDVLNGFLLDALRTCAVAVARCLDDMPPESMLWVDFEELRTNPKLMLTRILRFLDPDFSMDEPALERVLDEALLRVPIYAGGRTSLPAEESVQQFERLVAAARHRFGSPAA